MHKVFGKLIFKGIMLQNLISFYIEKIKSYASKLKVILTRFEGKKTISTPSIFGKCSSLATAPIMLKF
jgi:hypothetical protein